MKLGIKALTAPIVLAAMIGPAPAVANDTLAVLGAGGLELTTSGDIVMASEDLYLSQSQIRVRYVFRNESDHNITARVAFPLPDMSFEPDYNVNLPNAQDDNFVGFSVAVDGQPVEPALEQRAISNPIGFEGQPPVVMKAGIDITDKVLKAGLPINANLPSWKEKVEALPMDVRQQLLRQNILYDDGVDNEHDFGAGWLLRETYHWEQTFPAGKTVVVEHSHHPVAGGSIVYGESQFNDYKKYCLDDQGRAGLHRLLKQAQAAKQADPQRADGIAGKEMSYVLTTGANWKGPIEDFHLTIDKESPHAVLSLCMSGLEKTGPTTFEVRRTNFTPKEDIRFVVFEGT
jgi:hypothetical protein